MADRTSLKAKIAALRAKTKGNGCTEAEAMAAAELAARLMADHGLSEDDLVMTEAMEHEETEKATWRTKLNTVIAFCTNCTCMHVKSARYKGAMCVFIGRNPGPEIALYLREVCFRGVKTELTAFKAGTFYKRRRTIATRRQAAADFVDGMVDRIGVRLIDLFEPLRDEVARQESRNAMTARYGTGVAHRAPDRETRFSAAAAAGWNAGGKVALNRGVSTSGEPKQIAGGSHGH